MIIQNIVIPEGSILKKSIVSFDYTDSFKGEIPNSNSGFDIITAGRLFISSGPAWADNLMAIRDKAAGLFGLKTSADLNEEQNKSDNLKFEPGEQLGIFKLFDKTDNELILGENDKHLSFRVSVLLNFTRENKKELSLTTCVKYHNFFGRLYFLPVKPIHKLIVKSTLKNIIYKAVNTVR
ncbi:MAG: DUF2867 domain-containing protein [Ignavibacteria bacterium]|nr:DUF2867 domain-containing protein [Ignavibacteria bacterium]